MRVVLTFILLLTLSLATYAQSTYHFDVNHTYIIWRVSHIGFSDLSGRFLASGTLALDNLNVSKSSVNVNIDVLHSRTGLPQLDAILRSSQFMDSYRYPRAKFVSKRVVQTSKNTADVYGILTLRGISRLIILKVKMLNTPLYPNATLKSVRFVAATTLNRSDFAMLTNLPGVSDLVTIEIQAVAKLVANKTSHIKGDH